jgi:hypothetical protein
VSLLWHRIAASLFLPLNVLAVGAQDEVTIGIAGDQVTADRTPWHDRPAPDEPATAPGQSRGLWSKHVAMQKRLVDVVPHDAAPYGLC